MPKWMPKKKRILVIDDEKEVLIPIIDSLKFAGYETLEAYDGKGGLALAIAERPDLIILDLKLPDIDGEDVCVNLRNNPRTADACVLMVTARNKPVEGFKRGADDYLAKPYRTDELLARVAALLRRGPRRDLFQKRPRCVLTLSLEDQRQAVISVSGTLTKESRTAQLVELEVSRLSQKGNVIPVPQWQSYIEELGHELFVKFFGSHLEVQRSYDEALGSVLTSRASLHLRFAAKSDFLGVPVECLYERGQRRFLALHHPLARVVTHVATGKQPLSPAFFDELAEKKERLKILLIASNTTQYLVPGVPGADTEVKLLEQHLATVFDEIGVAAQVDVLPTAKASYPVVRDILRGCDYNIVHYAGHSLFDQEKSENSSLLFWEEEDCGGEVVAVRVSELETWLRDSRVNFFYLSSCSTAQTAVSGQRIQQDSLLGVADSIIQAGVPSVLGFRWPVSDRGALLLAQTFYASLAKWGQLDRALLEARQELHAKLTAENTWLSPVLILQGE